MKVPVPNKAEAFPVKKDSRKSKGAVAVPRLKILPKAKAAIPEDTLNLERLILFESRNATAKEKLKLAMTRAQKRPNVSERNIPAHSDRIPTAATETTIPLKKAIDFFRCFFSLFLRQNSQLHLFLLVKYRGKPRWIQLLPSKTETEPEIEESSPD